MATNAAVSLPTTPTFDWHNEDFSWLGDAGQGFGTGSPAELYLSGWNFDWLPDYLPPKAPNGGLTGPAPISIYVPDLNVDEGHTGVNVAGAKTAWDETFDGGFGMLSRVWGPGASVGGGVVTMHSTPDNQDSGAMVPPWGAPDSGFGYGLYSWTLSMGQGDAPGPYALLWPGTDKWPGPELDMVEIAPGGAAYSTIHWRGDDGSNQFTSYSLGGIDVKQVHNYQMLWEPGRLTGYVDGQEKWTTTDHVPADAAHGGQNEAPGVGMQTWWSADVQHGGGSANTLTLHEVSYSVIA